MKHTTINTIRKHKPCLHGWKKLLKRLDAKPTSKGKVTFKQILDSNGIEDAVWCLRVLPEQDYRLFKADVAELVLYIFEDKRPDDKRPRQAIEAARDFSLTDDERKVFADAAARAAYAAYAAADAADAAYAAYAATDAAAYATDAAYATTAYAGKATWKEIENLFIKHFC